MSADHYLCGPCEGMSLHRVESTITIRDTTGREPERVVTFASAAEARTQEWVIRNELYAKYGPNPAAMVDSCRQGVHLATVCEECLFNGKG